MTRSTRRSRMRSKRTRTRRTKQSGGNRVASIFAFVNAGTGAVSSLTVDGVLANTTAALSSPAPYQLRLAGIPATVGQLSSVKFNTWRDTGSWEPFTAMQDRMKVNIVGSRAIDLLSQGKPVRRTRVRAMSKRRDASLVLPTVLPELTITDLFDSNFHGLSKTGTPNPVDAAKGPVNIKIDLTFI